MIRILALLALTSGLLPAHDVFSTKITWSREISRIVLARCITCHQPGGPAFSLATFEEARPWAKAIKEEVLNRRMPPWGAVKGFGDFKNDPSLTQEEIGLFADWVEGGSPEGEKIYLPDMKDALAIRAAKRTTLPKSETKGQSRLFTGSLLLSKPASLVAIKADQLGASAKVIAELPDGSTEPLIWILDPAQALHNEYHYTSAVQLPKGTRIIAPQGSWRVVLR